MSEPLRIGILGAAAIAPAALVAPARRLPGVAAAAIAARNPDRAAAFARKHAIPTVHAGYAELLADPSLDAVYIALPPSHHARWAAAALDAGKHVLCEKPFTANAEQAAALARQAAAPGAPLLVEAFHNRYHPIVRRAQEIVAGGELGEVERVEAAFCMPMRRRRDIRLHYELAGGAMMDMGGYCVSLIRGLTGLEPDVLSAQAELGPPQVDRRMAAELALPNGGAAHLECALRPWELPRLYVRVQGSRGSLALLNPVLPHLFYRLEVRSPAGRRRERWGEQSTYWYQLAAFAAACRGEGRMATDAADAVRNMQVIDAVYRAAGLRLRGE